MRRSRPVSTAASFGSSESQANRERLLARIPEGWRAALHAAIDHGSFGRLADYLVDERLRPDTEIYPAESQVFRALELTRPDAVRAVIVGQDPYYTKGMATGLAFSVPERCRQPRSLQNILRARKSDLGLPISASGSLERWAQNGVLLLNTALTVRRGEANSHRRFWKPFTDAIIRAVSAQSRPIVFLLWGRQAREKRLRDLISDRHVVIESVHPAAWSTGAEPRFIDSRPFKRADDALLALDQPKICWSLPNDP